MYYIFEDKSSVIEDKLIKEGINYYQGETIGDALANKIVNECNAIEKINDEEKINNQLWIGKGINNLIESIHDNLSNEINKVENRSYKTVSNLQYELLRHDTNEHVILSRDEEGNGYRGLWSIESLLYSEENYEVMSQEDIDEGYGDSTYNKKCVTLY